MNKYIILFLLAAFFLLPDVMPGQSAWSKHYDFNIGNDYATHVVPVEDGVVVQAIGFCDFNSRDCHGLIKLDFNGDLIWKTILYDTLEINGQTAFVVRDDTILLNMNYLGVPDKAYSVLSFDRNGSYLSHFDYEQSQKYGARDMLIRPDGNLYVQFDVQDPVTNKIVEYTRCYDRNWNMYWSYHTPLNATLNQTKSAVCPDSGLIIGYTAWPGSGQDLTLHIEKYDKDGHQQWHTQYPYGCENIGQVVKINALPDGTCIGAFVSDSFGAFAANIEMWFKLDAQGNRVWEKANIMEERVINSSFVNRDGNIIACGTMPDYYFDTIQDPYLSAYLMCLNTDGERVWERKILDNTSGIYRQYVYGGAELPNGDLVFAGEVWDTLTTPGNPTYGDMWVFKTDSEGCFSPGCGNWQYLLKSQEPVNPEPVHTFGLYPNPAVDHCQLVGKLGEAIPVGEYLLKVYDATGRLVFAREVDPMLSNPFDTAMIPDGMYTAIVFRNGSIYQSIPLVKVGKR